MITYISEIKKIVAEYSRIKGEMARLEEMVKSLRLRQNQIEIELSQTREVEMALIDKIKIETGKDPNFYKILQEITENA